MKTLVIALIFSFICTNIAFAQKAEENKKKEDPWGLGLGVGLSFTLDTGSNDRVKTAEIVDGIVRVSDEENGIPRVVFEAHYFFSDKKRPWLGYGPFIAAQPGDGEVINAVALGWMFGFRRSESSTNSWNLGIGIAADPNVQILGEGIKPNEPLPGNETEIRFKEATQYGLMFTFSTSW